MARPTIDDAVAALERVAESVTELGVSKVAEKAGLPEKVVRKFVRDVLASKNSDIRKITSAVKELEN
jgi:hypothetical protein